MFRFTRLKKRLSSAEVFRWAHGIRDDGFIAEMQSLVLSTGHHSHLSGQLFNDKYGWHGLSLKGLPVGRDYQEKIYSGFKLI
jgi:hypothetical protein